MAGFTALHQHLLGSSVWTTAYHVRILWIAMLAMADRNGTVRASVPGLARLANVTREEAEDGLKVLMSPDPDTITQEAEGRRVEKVEVGWRILNHAKYRATAQDELRKEAARVGMGRLREERKAAEASAGGVQDASEGGKAGGSDPPLARTARRNRPLSLQEVRVMMEMEGIPEASYPRMAQEFFEHFESRAKDGMNGEKIWMTGESVVGDWKALFRKWRIKEDGMKAEKAASPGRAPVRNTEPPTTVRLKHGPGTTQNPPA